MRTIASNAGALAAVLCVALLAVLPARAEGIEKKFRVGLAIGGYDTADDVPSDSANVLVLEDPTGNVRGIGDPRNDRAQLGALAIQPAPRVTASAWYGLTSIFGLEASIGYQKDDVGDVEMQVQFNNQTVDPRYDYAFNVYGFDAGKMTQVPVQLTAMARFRPKANFNPYVGAGLGYVFVGFDPSEDLDRVSVNMDASAGAIAGLGALRGFGGFIEAPASSRRPLSGATVDARDTFEWHLAGGLEYGFKKRWTAFADARYIFASRTFELKFNGAYDLGIAVPDELVQVEDLDTYQADFGPMQIASGEGGLVDGGRLVPSPNAPDGTDCAIDPGFCEFRVGDLDGVLDPGFYYVKGGSIKYGGLSLQVGIRLTF